jgi:AraC-like DNA-binding protein
MPIPTFSYPVDSSDALAEAGSCPPPFGVEYVKIGTRCASSRTWYQPPTAIVCRLVFCLHGAVNWLVVPNCGIRQCTTLGAGCFIYDAGPGGCRRAVCASQKEAHLLQLRFSREVLAVLLGDARIVPLFPLCNASVPAQVGVQTITQQMSRTIGDIKHTLRHHGAGCLYVIARALELLAICCRPDIAEHRPQYRMEDYKAIQEAQTLLQDNLEKPPSLAQLAAEVGMSMSKLKILFPKMVGCPPYVYLRRLRMERAMALLVENGMNVTEAAMEVGYNSISYFTKAFYKQFGIYPSRARRQAAGHTGSQPDGVRAAG